MQQNDREGLKKREESQQTKKNKRERESERECVCGVVYAGKECESPAGQTLTICPSARH